MTLFDRMTIEQRLYALAQLRVLVEKLSLAVTEEELLDSGLIDILGAESMSQVEKSLLTFSLNHFGEPFSHEARETQS